MTAESSKKILVIEDDHLMQNLLLESLKAEGFATIAAETGELGLYKAKENLPDIVICELIMPDMDGYTVLTKLRQNSQLAIMPFIFLSTNNSKAALRKAMELGADDYLTKPTTIDELLKAIHIRLEKQSLMKSWYVNNNSPITNKPENPALVFPNIPHFQKVFDYIESHYHLGITLSDVAQAVGYSPAYLTNQVSQQTGNSVNSWIVKRRITQACFLLKNTALTIEEIATKIGYQNCCHFSRQFSQYQSLSPKMWRKQHQLSHVCTQKGITSTNLPKSLTIFPLD
ncbi:DNA-binding response regulator [Cylindrospermopsis raciborskii S07]|uniref:Response regulator n=1 Tax=Cylindrospermopsis raciborskii CS-506_A TaxID=2585140 RepID=A0A838WV43_9CYAN|nr:response regulator [Cylindrospermopsis raciborskii]MBA4446334.1 response regulator [Cylindrospermopsis raciborskii CS-506_C]MBA4450570.1 response regulator [Cylindrospermopsis raciborskii CS-506_D]MBA4457174.1 response regulator [Cylindrospermopsis raciborskii CS-506_B]MBA4466543.1 response regulator [Cylindrospermopsis raciborskii CS-506_A]OHY43352.1 DNA-binding response regulator [Cylindrospermopsis raciborskii CS-508]